MMGNPDDLDHGSLGACVGLAGTIAGAALAARRHRSQTYCTAPHCFRCLCGLPSLVSSARMRLARRARSLFIRVIMKPLVNALSLNGRARFQNPYALIGSPSRQQERRREGLVSSLWFHSLLRSFGQHKNVCRHCQAQLAGCSHNLHMLFRCDADVDVFVFQFWLLGDGRPWPWLV